MSEVERIIEPALDAFSDEIARHGHDYDHGGCRCGWQPRTTRYPRRSTGLHIAAAEKRADRQYDAESARLLRERYGR